jgi:hypothetical protein
MTERNRLTTVDNQHHHHHESQEKEEEIHNPFPAIIFDASYCGEVIPKGFDAVRIQLDGRIKADLSWKKEREAALAYITQGLRIFWEIDLGIQSNLAHPLSNKTQYLSLSLSLDHFCTTIWKDFQKETVGLCLYRGTLDFSSNFLWDLEQESNLQEWVKSQFCNIHSFVAETGINLVDFRMLTRETLMQSEKGKILLMFFCGNAVGEYLDLLASGMSNHLPLFVLMDANDVLDPFVSSLLASKERFSRFHTIVKGNSVIGELSWEGPSYENGTLSRMIYKENYERASCGVCIPKNIAFRFSSVSRLNKAFNQLLEQKIPFRVIPENEFMAEWNELDDLIVDSQFVDFQFKRQLQGFCAAGGNVVTLGSPLGLSQERSFHSNFK